MAPLAPQAGGTIHAPTWGATSHDRPHVDVDDVSIHASRRSRERDVVVQPTISYFSSKFFSAEGGIPPWRLWRHKLAGQSTRPHGARQCRADYRCAVAPVSIHAPAWGATSLSRTSPRTAPCFNPRARMGRDFLIS